MKNVIFADDIRRLRSEGYSYNKIRDILKCSKGTVWKYAKQDATVKKQECAFKTQADVDALNEYLKTHTYKDAAAFFKVSIVSVRKYSTFDRRNHIKQSVEDLREYQSSYKRNQRIKIKKECVEYKGGKCIVCGYDKCDRALDFHHLNPEEKDFTIASNNTKFRLEQLKPELDKCVLLCRNCHAELHAGLIELK